MSQVTLQVAVATVASPATKSELKLQEEIKGKTGREMQAHKL